MHNFKISNNEIKTTSEFLNGLVAEFREGEPAASGTLIEAFEPILHKYFRLLYDGVWDPDDRDTRDFLKMLSPTGCMDFTSTAYNLSSSMRRMYDSEDVRQELILILLTTAKKYTNISKNFRYEAKKRIKGILRESPIADRVVDIPCVEDAYAFIETGDIDMSWIKGLTAGVGWDKLSALQRAIIKYVYHDGLATDIAAKKLKISVRKLQRHKKQAKEILADYFNIQE